MKHLGLSGGCFPVYVARAAAQREFLNGRIPS